MAPKPQQNQEQINATVKNGACTLALIPFCNIFFFGNRLFQLLRLISTAFKIKLETLSIIIYNLYILFVTYSLLSR